MEQVTEILGSLKNDEKTHANRLKALEAKIVDLQNKIDNPPVPEPLPPLLELMVS